MNFSKNISFPDGTFETDLTVQLTFAHASKDTTVAMTELFSLKCSD